MAFTIELTRVGTGGRRNGGRADLRLSSCAASKHGRNPALGLRLAPQAMRRMGWMSGDLVTAKCEMPDGKNVVVVTMSRTTDEVLGCRLTDQGKDDGSGNVRFTVPQSAVDRIFTNGVKGYDGELASVDTAAGRAVFEVEIG
jgi:hypothetical protein